MTPSDRARNQAISLEAKKDRMAQRQSNDWAVTFTVQGTDMDARLTQAPMGTRFAMVLVEIGDDELPVQKEAAAKPRQDAPQYSRPDGAKRPWRDLDPTTQAGIHCNDPIFEAFLKEQHPEDWREAVSTVDCVRIICGVASRKYISTDHKARVIWKQLDDEFSAWRMLERA